MADICSLGVDAGSTTLKLAGVDAAGTMVWRHLEPTHPRLKPQIESLLSLARAAGAKADTPLVATGYGRKLVETATRSVTEITCHARGVYQSTGHGGTLIDIGGQDSKVIVIGREGRVENFAMNDKCAAGTGRFLEVIAGRLQHSLNDFSSAALAATREVAVSSTCTVFAESEVISLIAAGEDVGEIIRGLHRSLVRRVAGLARSTGVVDPVMLSGGVARSEAIARLLGEELGRSVTVPNEPQLMGAYGAALLGLG